MNALRLKLFNVILCTHVLYILITAIWPLLNIEGFMAVTGPKTDTWLVKTVSVLLIVISLSMLLYLKTGGSELPVILLGGCTALGLMIIDFYYSGQRIIRPIYAADGLIQAVFLGFWIWIFVRWLRDIY